MVKVISLVRTLNNSPLIGGFGAGGPPFVPGDVETRHIDTMYVATENPSPGVKHMDVMYVATPE